MESTCLINEMLVAVTDKKERILSLFRTNRLNENELFRVYRLRNTDTFRIFHKRVNLIDRNVGNAGLI